MSENNYSVSIKNLTIVYNDLKHGLEAVKDITMRIEEGEFVSVVGPSGCGKSTILRAISDTLEPSTSDWTGEIMVLGTTAENARKNRQVGFVFQKPTLLQWRTVEKNVGLPLEIIGEDKKVISKKVRKLLRLVDLDKYANYHPDQLSGGMQQRVSIARALAYDPQILLMDEPFGSLDEINRRRMNDELINVWQRTRKTIIFVTHSIEEAVYLSQKIIVLTKQPGRIKKLIKLYPRSEKIGNIEMFNYINQIRSLLENEEEII